MSNFDIFVSRMQKHFGLATAVAGSLEGDNFAG